MAVESTATTTGPLPADGSTTVFNFTFKAASDTEVAAVAYDDDDVEGTLPSFTATLTDSGGSVEFDTAPDAGLWIYLYSDPDFRQRIEFDQGSRWLASPVNEANDRAALRDLWLRDKLALFNSDALFLPSSRVGRYLAWDADGNPVPSSGTGADAALRTDLADDTGASLVGVPGGGSLSGSGGSTGVGFLQSGTGAVARTVQDKLRDTVSITDWGVLGDNSTNNETAMTAMLVWARSVYMATGGSTPRIIVPAGIYRYTNSPNWCVPHLHLDCEPGVVFHHTGTGVAFLIDNGPTDASYRIKITGEPTIRGNINTTYGIDMRGVHHSYIEVNVFDVATAILRQRWGVTNTFLIRSSGIDSGGVTVTPVDGVVLDRRDPGEHSSNCYFERIIVEQLSGYGIRLVEAHACTFMGGTSEANATGGIFIGTGSAGNTFIGNDLEFNVVANITCHGYRNTFVGMYDDGASTIGGYGNFLVGGLYNSVTDVGDGNTYVSVNYNATGSGAFTASGTNIRKLCVRNLGTNTIDPDVLGLRSAAIPNPTGGATIDAEARTAIIAILTHLRADQKVAP